MVRTYSDQPVDPDVVDRVLAHALRAPSAGNSQGWAFLVLDAPADVERYWRGTAGERGEDPDRGVGGMMKAPVVGGPGRQKDA